MKNERFFSEAEIEQSYDVFAALVRVAEPVRPQSYYDALWEDYRKLGSVQSRKNKHHTIKEK